MSHPGNANEDGLDGSLVLRIEEVCRELSVRIARLAGALEIDLDDEEQVARVLHHQAPAAGLPPPAAGSAERRREQLWTELRGLLLLRDEMEKRCVDQVGAAAARDILLEIERRMDRQGFRHGADGIDVDRLFGGRS